MKDSNNRTIRVLTAAWLMMDRPGITGSEIADELGCTVRTVRRYVDDVRVVFDIETPNGGGYILNPP